MIDKLDVIKDKLAVYKIWLLLGGIILIGCIVMIVIKQPKEVAVPTAYSMSSTSSSAAATSISPKTSVMIDVKGAVKIQVCMILSIHHVHKLLLQKQVG